MRSEAVSCFFICLCLLTLLPKRNEFPQFFLTIVASNEKVSSHFSQNCCQKQESTNPLLRQMFCQPYVVPNAASILCFAQFLGQCPYPWYHRMVPGTNTHPMLCQSYVVPNFFAQFEPAQCCAKSTQTFVCSGRRASAHVSEKQPGRVTTNNSSLIFYIISFVFYLMRNLLVKYL